MLLIPCRIIHQIKDEEDDNDIWIYLERVQTQKENIMNLGKT